MGINIIIDEFRSICQVYGIKSSWKVMNCGTKLLTAKLNKQQASSFCATKRGSLILGIITTALKAKSQCPFFSVKCIVANHYLYRSSTIQRARLKLVHQSYLNLPLKHSAFYLPHIFSNCTRDHSI